MTSAVLQFQEVNNPFKNEIMAPSDVSESPRARHGRGKHGGSVSKGGRTRASTLVNERQNLIAKALTWILKRGADSEDLKLDDEGFAECEELLEWQHLETNNITFPEIHAFTTSDPLTRFTLKSKTPASPVDPKAPLAPSNYLIALTTSLTPPDISAASLTPLSLAADNLPELVIYATTYAAYATILEEKQITNRSGTQIHFTTKIPDDAEVLIYIDIVAALEQGQKWLIHEAKGVVVTQGKDGAVGSAFWKKVVGKKGGLGTLFENGEVVKEVPVGAKKAVGKRARRRSGENLSAGKAGLVEVEVEEEDEE